MRDTCCPSDAVSGPGLAKGLAQLHILSGAGVSGATRNFASPVPLYPRMKLILITSHQKTQCRLAVLALGLLQAVTTSAAANAVASAAPVPAEPIASERATGPADAAANDAYRSVDMVWTDADRQREIPVRLYWPAGASAATPVPLVVFSHGMGGSRNGYSYLGKHWASLGFASLHVQHAGSDRALWTGNLFTLFGNLQAAASEGNAVDRAKDVSFAITSILNSKDYGAQISASAIAVAGHSYGANTAMLIGGATVERDGKPMSLRDDRVKALILISAPPFTGEGDMGKILSSIKVPTLHVTGTEDIIRVPGYYSDVADRVAVYDAVAAPGKLLTIFKGATHSIFTDRASPAGFELNTAVKKATRELSGLFLKTVLGGASGKAVDEWVLAQRGLLDRSAGSLSAGSR